MSVSEFGRVGEKTIHKITFSSPDGNLRATVISWGAVLQSLAMKNKTNNNNNNNNNDSAHSAGAGASASAAASDFTELTLGFDTLQEYQDDAAHIGTTVGRVANRIANATFPMSYIAACRQEEESDDENETGDRDDDVQLPANNNGHCLHGGVGWGRRSWDSFELIHRQQQQYQQQDTSEAALRPLVVGVELRLRSPHLDNGFPGALDVRCRYFFDERSRLVIDLSAALAADSPTSAVCNMTNHAYWNLSAGADAVTGHTLHVPNGRFFAQCDNFSIPTGAVLATAGTALDFTAPRRIGERIDDALLAPGEPARAGYDNFWFLSGGPATNSTAENNNNSNNNERQLFFKHAATAADPVSQRRMTVETTAAGVQIYTSNYMPERDENSENGSGWRRGFYRGALCLECQSPPDCVNQKHFASVLVRPGQTWREVTRHSFDYISS